MSKAKDQQLTDWVRQVKQQPEVSSSDLQDGVKYYFQFVRALPAVEQLLPDILGKLSRWIENNYRSADANTEDNLRKMQLQLDEKHQQLKRLKEKYAAVVQETKNTKTELEKSIKSCERWKEENQKLADFLGAGDKGLEGLSQRIQKQLNQSKNSLADFDSRLKKHLEQNQESV